MPRQVKRAVVFRRLLATCALAVAVASGSDASAQDPGFAREIDPFPVADESGEPYRFPFLGGLNTPRPQFVDIDADGDLDLFVQEVPNRVMFFENVGTPAAHAFAWRSDAYENLDVGGWVRFVDGDGDGDFDVLAEQPFSLVRYFRNDGTSQAPTYTAMADPLRDTDGSLINSDPPSVPSLVDFDCDGRLDLFLGRLDGSISRYEAGGLDAESVPRLAFVEDRFQDILIVGGTVTPGQMRKSLHGANSFTFADTDRDGDLDLFWGDFFEPNVIFFENVGTCAAPQLVRTSDRFMGSGIDPVNTGGFNAPAFADIDADGDLDFFAGVLGGAFGSVQDAAANFYYFENRDGLVLRTRRFLPSVDVGTESVPAAGDIDGDGDVDVLVGNAIDPQSPTSARLYLYRNVGDARNPSFLLDERGTLPQLSGFNLAPALVDIDADHDQDLVVGRFDGTLVFYERLARVDLAFAAPSLGYAGIDVGSNSVPTFADIDSDGDDDLFVGAFSGTISFYRNEGSPSTAAFVLEDAQFAGIDVGQRSAPAWTDVDGDDDLDLLVGSERNGINLVRNEGDRFSPRMSQTPGLALSVPTLAAPAAFDPDGDDDDGITIGGSGGGLVYFGNALVGTRVVERPASEHSGPGLQVYPTPTRGSVTVGMAVGALFASDIKLFDLQGRVVRQWPGASIEVAGWRRVLDLHGLPAGAYVVQLTVDGMQAIAARLVLLP